MATGVWVGRAGGLGDERLAEVAAGVALGAEHPVAGGARDRVPGERDLAVAGGGTEGGGRRAPPRSRRPAAGVAQAMPWRLKAAKIAVMCGVPSLRLPLSSSAASHCM